MTIKSSGPLSMAEINAEFGRGNSLSSYKGTKYYVGSTLGTFPSTISFSDFYGKSRESSVATVLFLTSGTSWTVPANWNRFNNKIEVIGGGGAGGNLEAGLAFGGGGGAYSRVNNVVLTPGAAVAYAVGAGGLPSAGAGGDTCFGASTIGGAGIIVGAKGGDTNSGGAAGSGVGSTRYSGGTGFRSDFLVGCGGGGAAGPGGNGGNTTSSAGAPGASGSWTRTSDGAVAVPGAGGSGSTSGNGVAGGFYGGAGGGTIYSYTIGKGGGGKSGGGSTTVYSSGGEGRQGIIVITYFPLAV